MQRVVAKPPLPQIRGGPPLQFGVMVCPAAVLLPKHAMRGSPSCMCKGQGSLAHECNEGVALVHVQGARVACPRRHTAGKGHFSRNSKGDRARVPAPVFCS